MKYQFGPISFGLNMCTGDHYSNKTSVDDDGFYIEENDVDPDKYRAGVLYFGIGPFKMGRNSEKIRNYFQNDLVHSRTGDPLFRLLDIDPEFFWYFGTGSGNTLW